MISLLIETNEVDKEGRKKNIIATNNVIVVYAQLKQRGVPDRNYSVPELEKHINMPNMKYRMLKDAGHNIYQTEKSKLLLRTNLKSVNKTSKFDPKGMPQYIVRYETEILAEDKQEEIN